jgi:hypothetical protein
MSAVLTAAARHLSPGTLMVLGVIFAVLVAAVAITVHVLTRGAVSAHHVVGMSHNHGPDMSHN